MRRHRKYSIGERHTFVHIGSMLIRVSQQLSVAEKVGSSVADQGGLRCWWLFLLGVWVFAHSFFLLLPLVAVFILFPLHKWFPSFWWLAYFALQYFQSSLWLASFGVVEPGIQPDIVSAVSRWKRGQVAITKGMGSPTTETVLGGVDWGGTSVKL